MQRRTFVMSGLAPLALAACGGGGDDNPEASADADASKALASVTGEEVSASDLGVVRQAFTLLAPVDGTESSGRALNNATQVVGISGAGEAADFGTTLWYRGSATRFPTIGGIGSGSASAINDAGKIVGSSTVAIIPNGSSSHATLWVGGRPVDLGGLNNAVASGATGINNAGLIVGWSYLGPETLAPLHATLWRAGRLTDLGTLGGVYSSANDINDAGTIVGWSTTAEPTGRHATVWRDGAVIELAGLGGTEHHANAINDAGLIVGSSSPPGTESGPRAVMWRRGRLTDLGTLGGETAAAHDVNNAGLAVGWSSLANDSNGHAALWHGKVPIDLNSLLDAATRDAGWYLGAASGINDHGWITGEAFNSLTGGRQGFLLSLRSSGWPGH